MCLEHATAAVSPPQLQGCKTLCAIKPGLVNDINIVLTWSLCRGYSAGLNLRVLGNIIIQNILYPYHHCFIAKSQNLSLGKRKLDIISQFELQRVPKND